MLTDGESLEDYPTGTPLGGSDDPRRAFKEHELTELMHLVADCRSWLLGVTATEAVLDPLLLVPPPAGTAREVAEDRFLELLDAVDAVGDGPIALPSEYLATDRLLDEILRWREDFGLDASRVLTRIRITEIGAEVTPVAVSTAAQFRADHASEVLASCLAAYATTGVVVVDIHSVPRCWGTRQQLLVAGSGSRYCRGRARLVEAA